MGALGVALGTVLVLGSCGDDADKVVPTGLDPVAVGGVIGLDVTVVGDVTEVLDTTGFRVDKDGVQGRRSLTQFDDRLGRPDLAERHTVVVHFTGVDVRPGIGVEVVGTLRQFDQRTLEAVYGLDLDDDLYRPFEDVLVLLAETVEPLVGPPSDEKTAPE